MCVGNFEVLRLYSREWLWSFTEPRHNSPPSPRYLMTMGNRKAKKFYYCKWTNLLPPSPAPVPPPYFDIGWSNYDAGAIGPSFNHINQRHPAVCLATTVDANSDTLHQVHCVTRWLCVCATIFRGWLAIRMAPTRRNIGSKCCAISKAGHCHSFWHETG